MTVLYRRIAEESMNEKKIYIKIYPYGDKVHERRISKNLTEEYLAEICDISDRSLRYIEAGHVVPKLDTALKIAGALDMDIGELNDLIEVRVVAYV
jgi:transcriptional regulator with XRE-family HTH domain